MIDCLNPYPAVVSRMRTAYRRHFPEAQPSLEEYLSRPEIYKEEIYDRIERIRSRI